MSDQQRNLAEKHHTAMDQDTWIARHKVLAALLVAVGGPALGFGAVWLLTVVL